MAEVAMVAMRRLTGCFAVAGASAGGAAGAGRTGTGASAVGGSAVAEATAGQGEGDVGWRGA
jgi:hypothetical protein